MLEGSYHVIEARPDYLTCSARDGDRADALERMAYDAIGRAEEAGDRVKPRGLEGYKGQGTDHIWSLRGPTGVVTVWKGVEADNNATTLAGLADHWSRFDLCVSGRPDTSDANPADEYYAIGLADDVDSPRLPTITQTRRRWGGTTTYIGSRASAIFARCYDKHAQNPRDYPEPTWRWELELKAFAAEAEHARYLDHPKRFDEVIQCVGRQFSSWSLPIPWEVDDDSRQWPQPPRRRTVDQKAEWLAKYVRQSAALVARHYGRGYVLRLLELDDDSMKEG